MYLMLLRMALYIWRVEHPCEAYSYIRLHLSYIYVYIYIHIHATETRPAKILADMSMWGLCRQY